MKATIQLFAVLVFVCTGCQRAQTAQNLESTPAEPTAISSVQPATQVETPSPHVSPPVQPPVAPPQAPAVSEGAVAAPVKAITPSEAEPSVTEAVDAKPAAVVAGEPGGGKGALATREAKRKKPATVAKDDPLQAAITAARDRRRGEFDLKIKQIISAKEALKRATIAGDVEKTEQVKTLIAGNQNELRKLMSAPLRSGVLWPMRFEVGQLGTLAEWIDVLQVLDKKTGEVLVTTHLGQPRMTFKVVGVDTKNMIDGGRFSSPDTFAVVGTHSYETVAGGSKTIFELHKCDLDDAFSADELKVVGEHADQNYAIVLTEAEQAQAKAAREVYENARLEKQAMAKEEAGKKELEMKARRGKSYLESAKSLLVKDQRPAARKFLEKAIADDPDSESGKEAAKLLKTLK